MNYPEDNINSGVARCIIYKNITKFETFQFQYKMLQMIIWVSPQDTENLLTMLNN